MLDKKLLLAYSVLMLGFTACPISPTYMLGGMITVPAGSDVKGTIIMACNIIDCNSSNTSKADVMTIDATGLSTQWRMPFSGPGRYQVIAVNTAQGLIGVYKNPANNLSFVEVQGAYTPEPDVNITMVKGAVPAQALDLFKTELSSP
jgi:hypothetical protein